MKLLRVATLGVATLLVQSSGVGGEPVLNCTALFEAGKTWAPLNLEWLTDGADRFAPGDQPVNRLVRP